jgi:lipopolysaccharide export system protein LptA
MNNLTNRAALQAIRRGAWTAAGCVLLMTGCFPGAFSLSAQPADSRKKVELIHADSIVNMTCNGKKIDRIMGHVQLMHNGAVMHCDSAYSFSSSEFEAYSRVVIVKDGTTLYGDRLHYDGAESMAKVRGRLVRLTDSTATLRTQHLDFNTKQNTGHFFNGGTIRNKGNLLESLQGYYYSDENLFVFDDSVSMRNETYDILAEAGNYNSETDVAVFTGATSIWHENGFLSCRHGWYDKPRDCFYFSENAYLQSDQREIWADSIFYDRLARRGDLYGHVQMLDTARSLIVFGDEAHFDEMPETVIVTRQPSMAYYTMENNRPDTAFMRADTLHLTTEPNPVYAAKDAVLPVAGTLDTAAADTVLPAADTLVTAAADAVPPVAGTLDTAAADTVPATADTLVTAAAPDSSIRKLFAHHNVRTFRSDLQAACDSFAYSSLDSLGRMFGKPVMWNEEQQISSSEIHFLTDQREILRAFFLQAAFIITHEQDTFYNQVKGRDIIAHFRDNDIYLADIVGGAQTIYYLQEDSLVTTGNLSESVNMQIELKQRKIQRIKYFSEPVESDTYPLDQLPAEKAKLKGYNWRDAERPKSRWDICREIARPSQREETAKIARPAFPITRRINAVE